MYVAGNVARAGRPRPSCLASSGAGALFFICVINNRWYPGREMAGCRKLGRRRHGSEPESACWREPSRNVSCRR